MQAIFIGEVSEKETGWLRGKSFHWLSLFFLEILVVQVYSPGFSDQYDSAFTTFSCLDPLNK